MSLGRCLRSCRALRALARPAPCADSSQRCWHGRQGACTTGGALPLFLASGAGAESRQPIGTVVVFGVAISALLTLIVVPGIYFLLRRDKPVRDMEPATETT